MNTTGIQRCVTAMMFAVGLVLTRLPARNGVTLFLVLAAVSILMAAGIDQIRRTPTAGSREAGSITGALALLLPRSLEPIVAWLPSIALALYAVYFLDALNRPNRSEMSLGSPKSNVNANLVLRLALPVVLMAGAALTPFLSRWMLPDRWSALVELEGPIASAAAVAMLSVLVGLPILVWHVIRPRRSKLTLSSSSSADKKSGVES